MRVLLNVAQLNSILPRVSELHREVLTSDEWRTSAGGRSHHHDLPAIAWRQILDAMLAQVYGPLGGKKAADSAYTACARIQRVLMRLEHHPALTGLSVVDVSNEVLPVFDVYDGYAIFGGDQRRVTTHHEIYPHEELTVGFALLRPMPSIERGWRLTRWTVGEPMRPGESRTFDPESHYLFTR